MKKSVIVLLVVILLISGCREKTLQVKLFSLNDDIRKIKNKPEGEFRLVFKISKASKKRC